ncbi:DNA invertase Pin-like site-specific DNA recombinase [Streptosporangium album]|uniref:DNA invertase Pin-like site-specific DNA recombinase n=1 Tax=Streptosporangium album TaxID=47479 RepID=A0A7W7W9U6_9ACTN|nr:recombinase family protein [Streptosporangium album]MBB4939286.1 DNA invertase Pin-like site-specific DNA recombinase [Streptosporangium album]MBB4944229.1 DNA invertase Pin-like site-specific DNA recombinase [Streptosporangium album]
MLQRLTVDPVPQINSDSYSRTSPLVDRAVALGWAACRVMVIDDDLGKSGTSAVDRVGFQQLVAEISLGHVGLVLGIDMSRLARSGRDWYQLLELCALSGALLADTDGVYDPADYNDRLLLGLKGTMSEAELHLIKQRMQAGRVNKARRGELAIALPLGYWRRPSGEVVLDPDEQVQAVVRLIFAMFDRIGTIQGVTRYLVEHGIEIGMRARSGLDKGEVVWRRPARATLTCLLNSPIYAGIYVYGRRRVDSFRQVPGRPKSGRTVQKPDQWLAMIEGALPAYISVEHYHRNLERLAANRPQPAAPGPAREGPALLAGLVRCGRCRRRMTVAYHVNRVGGGSTPRANYDCAGARAEWGGPLCQHLRGRCLDDFVAGEVLAALAPAALQVSLRAAEQIVANRAALERIWRQRLERAEINVQRARRCYRLAEPEKRLVVRQLEKEWEQALAARQQLSEDYHRFAQSTPAVLTPAEQATITALAADLPALWRAATTTDADRKEIIRAVVEEVTVEVRGRSELVDVTLTWAGGRTTQAVIRRPIRRFDDLSYYPQLAARVRELADCGLHPATIAETLNAEGFHPAKDHGRIGHITVMEILRRSGHPIAYRREPRPVHPDDAPREYEWWLPDLAAELSMAHSTLRRWITLGHITGRQETRPPHRWIVHADPATLAQLRDRFDRACGRTTRVHPRFADNPKFHLP